MAGNKPCYSLSPLHGVTFGQLAWLAGEWTGTFGADSVEEIWSRPIGNDMQGMFRWFTGEKVNFRELMTLRVEDDQVIMRLKHFDARLAGWEEKGETETMVLTGLRETRAEFLVLGEGPEKTGTWLIYERDGDTLRAWFSREGEAADSSQTFIWTRSQPEK